MNLHSTAPKINAALLCAVSAPPTRQTNGGTFTVRCHD